MVSFRTKHDPSTQRFNVAMTRARRGLICVGDQKLLDTETQEDKTYEQVMNGRIPMVSDMKENIRKEGPKNYWRYWVWEELQPQYAILRVDDVLTDMNQNPLTARSENPAG